MDVTVSVWSKSYEISVYQKSKTVWIAVGTMRAIALRYRGERNPSSCREAARYRGN